VSVQQNKLPEALQRNLTVNASEPASWAYTAYPQVDVQGYLDLDVSSEGTCFEQTTVPAAASDVNACAQNKNFLCCIDYGTNLSSIVVSCAAPCISVAVTRLLLHTCFALPHSAKLPSLKHLWTGQLLQCANCLLCCSLAAAPTPDTATQTGNACMHVQGVIVLSIPVLHCAYAVHGSVLQPCAVAGFNSMQGRYSFPVKTVCCMLVRVSSIRRVLEHKRQPDAQS